MVITHHCTAQVPGEWTWMHGDTLPNQPAVFGVQGISNPLNKPGSIYEGTEWVDQSGRFYFYGGLSINGTLADMWRFDPTIFEWTWLNGPGGTGITPVYGIKGVSSPLNHPGDRGYGMLSWVDSLGNLWMYGGFSTTLNTYMADLWKYDPLINEWTWISGDTLPNSIGNHGIMGVPSPSNFPPALGENACAFTEGDNLWFYGGMSNGALIGDLWRYSISSGEWTWMKGDTAFSAPPVYGTLGVGSPAGFPGARMCYSHWQDKPDNFWIFGGSIGGYANDLWRYTVSNNEWTWMSGANFTYDQGLYGSGCNSAPGNRPPARVEARSAWTDTCGNFWVFGGNSASGPVNDLWRYETNTGLWTWVSGDSVIAAASVFGSKGISAPTNKPGARFGSHAFKDLNGNLWLMSGFSPTGTLYNDLWRFVPDASCGGCVNLLQAQFSAPGEICPGACVDFINLSTGATSYQWFFPGGSPSSSTNANPSNICYSTPGNYDVMLIAGDSVLSDTLLINNYITVFNFPSPQGIAQSGDTLFANPGSATYQWYFNNNLIPGATNYFYLASASGDYNVVATDSNGCEVEAAIFNVLASLAYYNTSQITIVPNPANVTLTVSGIPPSGERITIRNLLGEEIFSAPVQSEREIFFIQNYPTGIYFLEIHTHTETHRVKFIKLD